MPSGDGVLKIDGISCPEDVFRNLMRMSFDWITFSGLMSADDVPKIDGICCPEDVFRI